MSEQLWTDEQIEMLAVTRLTRRYLREMRDEYEARIAKLEASQAAPRGLPTIEDDEVWLRLPDEAGGIL